MYSSSLKKALVTPLLKQSTSHEELQARLQSLLCVQRERACCASKIIEQSGYNQ